VELGELTPVWLRVPVGVDDGVVTGERVGVELGVPGVLDEPVPVALDVPVPVGVDDGVVTGERVGVELGVRVPVNVKVDERERLVVRVGVNPGESFLDRMIAMVEGAKRQKTPNEIALTILLVALTLVFLVVTVTLLPYSIFSVEVAGAVPVDHGEAELLEVHEHVQDLTVCEAPPASYKVEQGLMVDYHGEWFTISEVHGPVHDCIVEAKCFAFGCPPFCSVAVIFIICGDWVIYALAEVSDRAPVVIPRWGILWRVTCLLAGLLFAGHLCDETFGRLACLVLTFGLGLVFRADV
jgi:hypothetical protein